MKILLLGDADSYHATLAQGLRKLGHDVTLASDNPADNPDILLPHGTGLFAETLFLAKLSTVLAGKLRGYDVVQIASTDFINLSTERRKSLFKKLKSGNGAVYMTALKPDSVIVGNLAGSKPALAYSRWKGPRGLRPWAKTDEAAMNLILSSGQKKYAEFIYNNVDGIVSGRYEYHKAIESAMPDVELGYGGIPVDVDKYGKPLSPDFNDRFSVLVTMSKKSDDRDGMFALRTMLEMAETHSRTNFRTVVVPQMSEEDFISEMKKCRMVGEDIYTHSPGRMALAAMALGIVPICGAEDDFYKFIGEDKLRPAFNPAIDHIKSNFKDFTELLANPASLAQKSAEGPEFVRKHNDAEAVAERFVKFWSKTGNR